LPWHGDDDYDDPGHDACTSALLDGFTVEEITEAGG
jgi:hypothetical protein